MPTEPISSLLDFARSRELECELVRDEARVFMPTGLLSRNVSVRARLNELGQVSFQTWFGRMPAIYEMTVSMAFFAALLIFALVNRSDRSPSYVPYLATIVFVGNAYFEFSRYWKARRFISEAQHAI